MYDPKKVLDVKHYEHCIVSKPLYDEGINYLISGRRCLSQDDDFVVLARTALPELAQRVIELEAKSATLLAIAEAAQELIAGLGYCQCGNAWCTAVRMLRQALAALEGGAE
jgi:hypothetical protein